MKVLNTIKSKYIQLIFKNKLIQLNKQIYRNSSTSINKDNDSKKKIDDESSQEFYIETMDLENNKNFDIFQEKKKSELSNISKLKNEDKYEKINNLKAYQLLNNNLIIDLISKNRDIRRAISDKTDCSDDNFIGFSEGVWNNNIENKSTLDQEELDNNKIEELIEYVKKTKLEDLPKTNIKEINQMSNREYKKYIIDVLKFLQINIDKKYTNKSNEKEYKINDSIREVNERLDKKFQNENKNIDKYFLEKQVQKRIIFGKQKKFTEEELDDIVEYLNQESRIDFRNIKENDPDIIDKYIPQTHKDRKKFKDIIDLKTEVILV